MIKMKTLIIYAHPATEGYNSYILNQVKENLYSRNENFEVIDLYKIGYDPVLSEDEHYVAGNKNVSEQNKRFQSMIKNTDKMVIIYPVWWGGMPAILKGFFDRVLTPGFAFNYSREKWIKSIPYKYLKDKKAVVLMTSGGPKMGYVMLGNPAKIGVKYFTLWFTGVKSKIVRFYDCKKIDETRKKEIRRKVSKGLKWLYK